MADAAIRSFSAKRSRLTAAEVRKKVLEGSYIAGTQPNNGDPNEMSAVQRVFLPDLANPVDVEEALSSRMIARTEIRAVSSSPQRIRDLTEKDVDLVTLPRTRLFSSDELQSALENDQIEGHVKELIASYDRDFTVVERRYENFSSGESYSRMSSQRLALAESMPKQIYDGYSEMDDRVPLRSVSQVGDHPDLNRHSTASIDSNGSNGSKDDQSQQLQASTCDPMLPSVTMRLPPAQVDESNEKKRNMNRSTYVVNLMPLEAEADVIEKKPKISLPTDLPNQRLAVRFLKLQFDVSFEPIFASVALFDVNEKRKVSENFYFDMNSDELLTFVRGHLGIEDEASKCRQALFPLSDIRPGLFLVFKLEKVLQGCDIGEAVEPYVKDDKNKEKLLSSAREYCDRLGSYRMPFAWAALDLHNVLLNASVLCNADLADSMSKIDEELVSISSCTMDTESIISADRLSTMTTETLQHTASSATITSQVETPSHKRKNFFGSSSKSLSADNALLQKRIAKLESIQPLLVNVNTFYKQDADRLTDEELLKILVEARKPNSSKLGRLKVIPVEFKMELSMTRLEDVPAKLSSELLPMVPFTREIHDPLTKDVLAFPKSKDFTVNSFYRNLLFVHPKNVNLSARPGNARNICVRMELVDSNARPLKAVFGKSSALNFSNRACTSVLYHNKNPQFGDEIKFQLPVDLNDGHHILFTFLHISCKANKPGEIVETPVGYTWHPLYRGGQLQTGEFTLPISLDPLPNSICYLSPLVNVPSIKWLDGHKPLFQVSISAISTVHPQDEFLAKFFTAFHSLKSDGRRKPSEIDMIRETRAVIKAPPQPLVNFLYAILDRLLALIGSPPYTEALTQACFETLSHLVKVCTMLLDGSVDSLGRSQLLVMYLHFNRVMTGDALKGLPMSPQKTTTAPLAAFEEAAPSTGRDSVDLINVIQNYERKTSNKLLASVDEMVVEGDRKLMHEEIAAFLVRCEGSVRETTCSFSWFFLELILKSMSEYLGACNRFFLPRKLRFRDSFLQHVHQLTTILSADVIDKLSKDPRQARSANASLAFFLRDLLSLVDRTFVLQLVRDFLTRINEKLAMAVNETMQTALLGLRIAFLRIVCSHEHFTILNLPFDLGQNNPASVVYQSPFKMSSSFSNGINALQAPPSPSGSSSSSSRESSSNTNDSQCPSNLLELTPAFRSKHFLLGVVLSDLCAVLHSTNTTAQAKTIGLVRSLLATHETDLRLSDAALKNRIASLYLPLIGILMDIRGSLFDPYSSSTDTNGATTVFPRRAKSGPGVNPKVALAISGLADERPDAKASPSPTYTYLSKDHTQQLLVCFCWVIKNLDKNTLRHWMRELSPQRVHQFVDLLQLCVSCFEHDPSTRPGAGSTSSSAVVDASAACVFPEAAEEVMSAAATSMPRKGSDSSSIAGDERTTTVRWRFDEVNVSVRKRKTTITVVNSMEAETMLEKQLSTEVSLIAVDTIETLLKVLGMPASDHLHYLRPVLVRLLLHMLACHQSVRALESIFSTQRSVVANHASLIFEERTELCAELCLQLLRHFGSRLPVVRSNAAASLYLLMRHSFEFSSCFSKVKMQITMSLSTLVSNASSYGFVLNEAHFRRSLKTLLTYLENDLAASPTLQPTSFGSQMKDLIFNLHMILSDTVKMKNVSNDFEMLIDLMFRIAKGYQSNPDLRLTWLINIANKHAEREHFVEAAQCILHCAALVAEHIYARTCGEVPLPRGAIAFEELSENILEESAVSDDVVDPDDEGVCESAHFTVDGFVHLVKKAADFFDQAQMYELLPHVYKLVMPIFEARNDFTRLAQVHQIIAEQLKLVDPPVCAVLDASEPFLTPLPGTDKRCFGTFFRVGFYGHRFGDLNGEEFVYKEPAITKLSEISHRLEAFYVERLGRAVVEVIKDSNDVDPRKLNSDKAYLQITYVEPFLEAWERRRRGTHLQCNYKLRRFVYATPFTKDGRAHGELKDQFKRRTVLTVQHSFPYLKTRIRVVSREQTTLSPIEVAIEDVQKKTRELTAATLFCPPDAKMLQMVLQGCIGTTVNAGPVQIAKVFLASVPVDERGKPRERLQNKLRLCFKDFAKKCGDALIKNEQLIGADQADYQRELRRNYVDFQSQLNQIIGCPRAPLAQIQLSSAQAVSVAADLGPATSV